MLRCMGVTSMLNPVADDRRYDDKYGRNARSLLLRFVHEKGSQSAAAKALGVNQSTVQRATQPLGQPSLRVLLALREQLGLTIEEMLGVPPIDFVGPYSTAEYAARLRSILVHLEREVGPGVRVARKGEGRPR